MADYERNMVVSGDLPGYKDGSLIGYQLGGNLDGNVGAGATASHSFETVSPAVAYRNIRIICKVWSAIAPSSWLSSWGGEVKLNMNHSARISPSSFNGYSASNHLSELTFIAPDEGFQMGSTALLMVLGDFMAYINSNHNCAYLQSAVILADIVDIDTRNYLLYQGGKIYTAGWGAALYIP